MLNSLWCCYHCRQMSFYVKCTHVSAVLHLEFLVIGKLITAIASTTESQHNEERPDLMCSKN